MIHLTQLIYLHPGTEDLFEEFESVAIPLIARHGGDLLLRLRPDAGTRIAGSARRPYEVHLISFPSEDALRSFMADGERNAVIDKKELSVESSLLIKGEEL